MRSILTALMILMPLPAYAPHTDVIGYVPVVTYTHEIRTHRAYRTPRDCEPVRAFAEAELPPLDGYRLDVFCKAVGGVK